VKKGATAASGSILSPPASPQEQTAVAVCRKGNQLPLRQHNELSAFSGWPVF